jgi:hypothetical protein
MHIDGVGRFSLSFASTVFVANAVYSITGLAIIIGCRVRWSGQQTLSRPPPLQLDLPTEQLARKNVNRVSMCIKSILTREKAKIA